MVITLVNELSQFICQDVLCRVWIFWPKRFWRKKQLIPLTGVIEILRKQEHLKDNW